MSFVVGQCTEIDESEQYKAIGPYDRTVAYGITTIWKTKVFAIVHLLYPYNKQLDID